MRIKVDIEVSPEEIRTLIGLPNLGGLQEDMIHYMRDKMSSGVEESKEIAMMLKQFLPESVSTASNLQKIFNRGVERFTTEMGNAAKANTEGAAKKTAKNTKKSPSSKDAKSKKNDSKPTVAGQKPSNKPKTSKP